MNTLKIMSGTKSARTMVVALGLLGVGIANATVASAQFRQEIPNDLSACRGDGPAVRVTVNNIRETSGTMRVQIYRGTSSDWLQKGRWLSRIEVPARRGTMNFCLPVPSSGTYAVAVRHDFNGNGKTDIRSDGGGMSNNPSINIFNLGRPPVRATAFTVGNEVQAITINMRYMQ